MSSSKLMLLNNHLTSSVCSFLRTNQRPTTATMTRTQGYNKMSNFAKSPTTTSNITTPSSNNSEQEKNAADGGRTYQIQPMHYTDAPVRTTSIYPTVELKNMVIGRHKRSIGSLYGITNFGFNITTLLPPPKCNDNDTDKNNASATSIVHYHTKQDEMIYIISGTATITLYHPPSPKQEESQGTGMHDAAPSTTTETTNSTIGTYQEIQLTTGDVIGFPAGRTIGHSIRNTSTTGESLVLLEVGDRTPGDIAIYPEPHVDLIAKQVSQSDSADTSTEGGSRPQYQFFHKDGSPY